MKRGLLLVAAVLLAGCFDDGAVRQAEPERAVELDAVEAPVEDGPPPPPTVLNVTGGYALRGPLFSLDPSGNDTIQVSADTPWIAEVRWYSEGGDEPMTFAAYADDGYANVTGYSPLRMEFPDGRINGTVTFDLYPAVRPYAADVTFTVYASLFERGPFDAGWTALP